MPYFKPHKGVMLVTSQASTVPTQKFGSPKSASTSSYIFEFWLFGSDAAYAPLYRKLLNMFRTFQAFTDLVMNANQCSSLPCEQSKIRTSHEALQTSTKSCESFVGFRALE